MSAIKKKQFYNGQSVTKGDMNAILDYTSTNIEQVVSTNLGYGVISGFALTNEGGFALGVSAGLAYANDGKRLILEAGKQVDLTTIAPTVGTKTVLVGMLQDFIPSEPTTDNEGNLVYTKLTETVKFVSGISLASEVLPLASVELSSSGILIITSIAPTMEVAKAVGERTKGLVARDKSIVFVRDDGFEHDLIRGVWRKPTFDTTKTEGYAKGDIIWLLPPDDGTLWTPPATEVTYPWTMTAEHPYNLLGKEKTYQAQTSLNLYAIRLRSTKDNNTDNPLTDKACIGSSWVVDEPWAIFESGSNVVDQTTCLYKIFANLEIDANISKQFTGMVTNVFKTITLKFPLVINSPKLTNFYMQGPSSSGNGVWQGGDGGSNVIAVTASSMTSTTVNMSYQSTLGNSLNGTGVLNLKGVL